MEMGSIDSRLGAQQELNLLRSGKTPNTGLASADQQALFDLYDRMLGDVELPSVLRDVAQVVCQDLRAERASVYLIDQATNELESAAVIGNVARLIRVPIDTSSLAGYCAMTGRAFVVPDAYGDLSGIDPRLKFDRRWDDLNDFRTRDVMCAPALFKGQVVGVVQVINSKDAPFREADLRPLKILSRLIGYALYHARLYDDLATMKQLEKQKAGFMRVMVHELKSPVAGAKMLADALQYHEAIANSPAIEVTRRISNRMGQLTRLIKDLLVLAKVKSGDPLGEVSVIDLVAETEAGSVPYRDQAQQKGLAMTVNLPAEPVRVRFDAQGYRIALSNLVSNAVKYTRAGSVSVVLRTEGRWAVLEVADTGIGIPEKDLPKLFTEFFRASNARASDIDGSGVGLAGAKTLVERFGGEFSLRTQENEGSTFTIRLPTHT
jgi:signal transduction histidine kinase